MNIYYFTYTGTSKKIAEWLSKKLNIRPKEIKTYKLPYLIWLFLSFFPYLPFKATFDPPSNKTIILCFPKWTFNCPPVTYFLKKVHYEKLFLVISYKGWGERLYYRLYYKLACKKTKEIKIIFIKKKLWEAGIFPEIEF
ncbi:MAG: Flavodoxin [Thermodesulfobacterium sp.]|uniref:Flavodoxin n=1 Tax=Candidatus Thermodesulfobacterium syntrophicum TaxID=3060442 RepID=A0AAE3P640_9BACT|nr:Flavodoxin [Candidatus Thermodesulfobacterium syntrophicum]